MSVDQDHVQRADSLMSDSYDSNTQPLSSIETSSSDGVKETISHFRTLAAASSDEEDDVDMTSGVDYDTLSVDLESEMTYEPATSASSTSSSDRGPA